MASGFRSDHILTGHRYDSVEGSSSNLRESQCSECGTVALAPEGNLWSVSRADCGHGKESRVPSGTGEVWESHRSTTLEVIFIQDELSFWHQGHAFAECEMTTGNVGISSYFSLCRCQSVCDYVKFEGTFAGNGKKSNRTLNKHWLHLKKAKGRGTLKECNSRSPGF